MHEDDDPEADARREARLQLERALRDAPAFTVARWIFNCHVIVDAERNAAVLVDAGLPVVARDALARLDALPGRPAIAGITATHGHSDHVSGVGTVLERGSVPVWLPKRAKAYLEEGERPRTPGLREILRIHPVLRAQRVDLEALGDLVRTAGKVGYSGASPFRFPVAPAAYLEDGAALPGVSGWRAFSVPGHTDDSTALYHEASRTLIAGDAVLTYDGRAWFNPEFVDLERSRETEKRLRALDVETLLPGHGPTLRGKYVMRGARPCR